MNPNLRGEDHAPPHAEPPDPPRARHCWRRGHSCERSRQESAQGPEGPDQGKPPPKKGPKLPPGPPPDGGRAQPPTAWSPPRPGSSRKTSSPRTSSFSWPPKVPLEVDLQCRTARGRWGARACWSTPPTRGCPSKQPRPQDQPPYQAPSPEPHHPPEPEHSPSSAPAQQEKAHPMQTG